jgi:hypothetical protein
MGIGTMARASRKPVLGSAGHDLELPLAGTPFVAAVRLHWYQACLHGLVDERPLVALHISTHQMGGFPE